MQRHGENNDFQIGIGVANAAAENARDIEILLNVEISEDFSNNINNNFVPLHQLINQVVKGVTGSSFRRSLLFYSPRTLSKVSLWCAASQLDMPSTVKRTPVLSPKQQDIFLLRDI